MGYNLDIGNAKLVYDKESGYTAIKVESVRLDEAPAFGEPTDHTNSRWPSYRAWREAMEFVGLGDMFFDERRDDSLLRSHPGVAGLTEAHRKEVNRALEKFKAKYPDAVPTYGKVENAITERDHKNPEYNSYMCRLVWLHFWINWALDNCEMPVFVNG